MCVHVFCLSAHMLVCASVFVCVCVQLPICDVAAESMCQQLCGRLDLDKYGEFVLSTCGGWRDCSAGGEKGRA